MKERKKGGNSKLKFQKAVKDQKQIETNFIFVFAIHEKRNGDISNWKAFLYVQIFGKLTSRN